MGSLCCAMREQQHEVIGGGFAPMENKRLNPLDYIYFSRINLKTKYFIYMVVLRVLFVTENLKVADELQYKKTFLGLDDLEEDVLQTSFGKSLC